MEFGDWVVKARKEQNMALQTLSERTDVDMGTISRIEHSQTNATVFTAFRLSQGLGTSLKRLVFELTDGFPAFIEPTDLENADAVLSLQDVEALVDNYDHFRDGIYEYLRDTINGLLTFIPSKIEMKYGGDDRLIPLSTDDIERLLFTSPLYNFNLKYPFGMGARRIQQIYERGGVLVPDDIHYYTRGKKLEGLTRMSSNVSIRLTGAGALERVKLNELMSLDKELGEEGRLLGIYWESCRFMERFTPPIQHSRYSEQPSLFGLKDSEELEAVRGRRPWEYKLALLYVLLYRWYFYLRGHAELPPFWKYEHKRKL